MEKVLKVSIFLVCMVCLLDIVTMRAYDMKITEFEKDCVNYSCRHTGKIIGSIGLYEEYVPSDTDCLGLIYVAACEKKDNCSIHTSWKLLCPLYWCGPEDCKFITYPCYCSGSYPVSIKFFPLVENALYRITGIEPYGKPRRVRFMNCSNIFDSSLKPANYDPLERPRLKTSYSMASLNGESRLHPEFILLVMGALVNIFLAQKVLA
ncbi:uncharacterized protein LOC131934928 [Physella acuta]|uniref:uncharacterized protein LOC131934928 n=1 Tax=Physella acuta TaxID=109671 RepID=UPI0027DBF02F|nr:uncharacterized protein LOC131934928 [Physella acuta]